MRRFVYLLLLVALVVAGGWLGLQQWDAVRQVDGLRRRCAVLENQCAEVARKEAQLRACYVRRAVPRRTSDGVEDPRLLQQWQLDFDELEWRPLRPAFGVDRSKLRGGTGDVAD